MASHERDESVVLRALLEEDIVGVKWRVRLTGLPGLQFLAIEAHLGKAVGESWAGRWNQVMLVPYDNFAKLWWGEADLRSSFMAGVRERLAKMGVVVP